MHYTLGRLFDEANLVRERENNTLITQAQLAQHSIYGLLSKQSRTAFTKMVKSLNFVTKPFRRRFDP